MNPTKKHLRTPLLNWFSTSQTNQSKQTRSNSTPNTRNITPPSSPPQRLLLRFWLRAFAPRFPRAFASRFSPRLRASPRARSRRPALRVHGVLPAPGGAAARRPPLLHAQLLGALRRLGPVCLDPRTWGDLGGVSNRPTQTKRRGIVGRVTLVGTCGTCFFPFMGSTI